MTSERQLCNGDAPQPKSVYDQQRVARPAVYTHCGRASFGIGVLCMLAEVSVFIIKRGLTTMGIGIWTGAPFVILGAVTMAVPKTRTVCSINTCLAFCVGSLAVAFIGVLLCIAHILELSLILQQQYTPSPNFELHCRECGYYIVLKETGQIGLLLVQSLVSAILLCFAYKDCLCCRPTETHLVTANSPVHAAASLVTENQNAACPSPTCSVRQIRAYQQQQQLPQHHHQYSPHQQQLRNQQHLHHQHHQLQQLHYVQQQQQQHQQQQQYGYGNHSGAAAGSAQSPMPCSSSAPTIHKNYATTHMYFEL